MFIEKAKLIHNNKYDYSLVKYINNKTKVKIICPEHGIFEQLPSAHLQGQGCPKCKKSKMESSVIEFFTKNNIEFAYQKKFKDLKDKTYLSYDFYIPSKNLLIECQGKQHYIQSCFNRNRKDFLLQKHHDWLKRNYARKNNFELLTVSFDENIDSFLKKCYTYAKEER
jgi:very-short-patch-repair endonuclease